MNKKEFKSQIQTNIAMMKEIERLDQHLFNYKIQLDINMAKTTDYVNKHSDELIQNDLNTFETYTKAIEEFGEYKKGEKDIYFVRKELEYI